MLVPFCVALGGCVCSFPFTVNPHTRTPALSLNLIHTRARAQHTTHAPALTHPLASSPTLIHIPSLALPTVSHHSRTRPHAPTYHTHSHTLSRSPHRLTPLTHSRTHLPHSFTHRLTPTLAACDFLCTYSPIHPLAGWLTPTHTNSRKPFRTAHCNACNHHNRRLLRAGIGCWSSRRLCAGRARGSRISRSCPPMSSLRPHTRLPATNTHSYSFENHLSDAVNALLTPLSASAALALDPFTPTGRVPPKGRRGWDCRACR